MKDDTIALTKREIDFLLTIVKDQDWWEWLDDESFTQDEAESLITRAENFLII